MKTDCPFPVYRKGKTSETRRVCYVRGNAVTYEVLTGAGKRRGKQYHASVAEFEADCGPLDQKGKSK
jgi:hypothetical protein